MTSNEKPTTFNEVKEKLQIFLDKKLNDTKSDELFLYKVFCQIACLINYKSDEFIKKFKEVDKTAQDNYLKIDSDYKPDNSPDCMLSFCEDLQKQWQAGFNLSEASQGLLLSLLPNLLAGIDFSLLLSYIRDTNGEKENYNILDILKYEIDNYSELAECLNDSGGLQQYKDIVNYLIEKHFENRIDTFYINKYEIDLENLKDNFEERQKYIAKIFEDLGCKSIIYKEKETDSITKLKIQKDRSTVLFHVKDIKNDVIIITESPFGVDDYYVAIKDLKVFLNAIITLYNNSFKTNIFKSQI